MTTPIFRTPGIYVQNILVEPVRELRTGVPLFVGLVTAGDLDARNARLPKGKRFRTLELKSNSAVSIVRKEDQARLPSRNLPPNTDQAGRDLSSSNPNLVLRAGEPMPAGDKEMSRKPQRYTLWPQFRAAYGELEQAGLLLYSVRGFFENEGDLCYVQVFCFKPPITYALLSHALATLQYDDDFDLVCVPDLAWVELQRQAAETARADADKDSPADERADEMAILQMAVLDHCMEAGNRMAILDTPFPPNAAQGDVQAGIDHARQHRRELGGDDGALYFPWLRINQGPPQTGGFVPPSGHVAGIFNRSDARTGVHKAPANEVVQGALDLAYALDAIAQEPLNAEGINCLRVFPRRGVRVWGARTLSNQAIWRHINVRRVMLTMTRWIERTMRDVLFEPHTPWLWERVTRDITAYLNELARRGALLSSPGGALFYVKCDAETNPPEQRETGHIVTEIGLAAAPPTEFIVIRLIHGPAGVRIEGPN